MLRSLVGSEMCIRDRYQRRVRGVTSATMVYVTGGRVGEGPHRPPLIEMPVRLFWWLVNFVTLFFASLVPGSDKKPTRPGRANTTRRPGGDGPGGPGRRLGQGPGADYSSMPMSGGGG
eukprot:TRINITY_DN4504_c0_g1_i1.p2 TRINITY_DN4504_c0_g1~~TRINITY_DN4504_c0_g1_i1.p2  ORF type:complete len:118 (-),score=21.47 TRINITY_DN4504_c0_g1_i1:315-668(-)